MKVVGSGKLGSGVDKGDVREKKKGDYKKKKKKPWNMYVEMWSF